MNKQSKDTKSIGRDVPTQEQGKLAKRQKKTMVTALVQGHLKLLLK